MRIGKLGGARNPRWSQICPVGDRITLGLAIKNSIQDLLLRLKRACPDILSVLILDLVLHVHFDAPVLAWCTTIVAAGPRRKSGHRSYVKTRWNLHGNISASSGGRA